MRSSSNERVQYKPRKIGSAVKKISKRYVEVKAVPVKNDIAHISQENVGSMSFIEGNKKLLQNNNNFIDNHPDHCLICNKKYSYIANVQICGCGSLPKMNEKIMIPSQIDIDCINLSNHIVIFFQKFSGNMVRVGNGFAFKNHIVSVAHVFHLDKLDPKNQSTHINEMGDYFFDDKCIGNKDIWCAAVNKPDVLIQVKKEHVVYLDSTSNHDFIILKKIVTVSDILLCDYKMSDIETNGCSIIKVISNKNNYICVSSHSNTFTIFPSDGYLSSYHTNTNAGDSGSLVISNTGGALGIHKGSQMVNVFVNLSAVLGDKNFHLEGFH